MSCKYFTCNQCFNEDKKDLLIKFNKAVALLQEISLTNFGPYGILYPNHLARISEFLKEIDE